MKPFLQRILLWFVFFISPFTLYAQSDNQICQWVKGTLLDTFSLDYTYKPSDGEELRKSYTENAWDALTEFLGNYLPIIREKRLTLHPVFIKEPFIAEKGIFSGVHFWRVNEVLSIPELNIIIAFSVLVIETSPLSNGRYLIQSMDMVKKESS
ncbi:DotI/IcmL/TraM family protein [Legionella tucsonensis]|uniref:Protein IcmL (DotI) n=1 Tax=Legionella tucsonensis TaxID=40335 RepID=A0A0W0ZZP0_9GAMM|nr:DotI/IcmL/TraM family protein [Legionella tucsonensis]KTD74548.1 protein IcmL (DotI) [Legionella tucsonensis]